MSPGAREGEVERDATSRRDEPADHLPQPLEPLAWHVMQSRREQDEVEGRVDGLPAGILVVEGGLVRERHSRRGETPLHV